ncbi:peptidase family M48-domain-containing protein [Hysterangium stoloniferum]|nr:peptidase family M48-domain-containing protein [Hysterangium stoloniferum]
MEVIHSFLDSVNHRLAWVTTDYAIPWKKYVLLFSWSHHLFETYLLMRQYPNYSKTEPPRQLAAHFTGDVFAKSQAYGKDKAKFSLVSGLFNQILETAVIYYGGYAWAWEVAGNILGKSGYGSEYEIPQSIVFAAVLFAMSSIQSLPVEVYKTFVLEQKHGFNKTTPKLFVTDHIKNWFVALVVGAPFLSAFLAVVRWAGDRFVPWLMAFLLIFQMLMIFIYPSWIQPLFNKLSPLPEGPLRTKIEALASGLKFPLKHLYEIDGSKRSSHSNAYFFGLPWSKHIVVFDTLIKQSTPEEVEAVLAHELGHWYYMHPSQLMLVSQLHIFSILAIFPPFLHSPPLLRSFDFAASAAAKPPILVSFLLFQMILTPLETFVGIGMNFISRKFEWEADAFACELHEKVPGIANVANMGERLGKALTTIHIENLSTVWVDWLFSAVHHSHPTLTERLKALEEHKTKNAPSIKKEL